MAERTFDSLGLTRLPAVGAPVDASGQITGIAVDSRLVRDGFVFVAVPGERLDGAQFAQFAVRQGAAAVIATAEGVKTARADLGALEVPFLLTENPRSELARLAAAFEGRQPETMIAVTGTNGKTSVAHFTHQIWAALGLGSAVLGTAGVEGEGFAEPLAMTTPEPVGLHALLARLAGKGCTHAAMEASSHGLAQHRLDGVRLAAAALTNITRDHLDYHKDHADYVAAKLRLFAEVLPEDGTVVVNAADPVLALVREIAERRGQPVTSVGMGNAADLQIGEQRFLSDGQDVTFHWGGKAYSVSLKLVGGFQALNAGLAAGLVLACGAAPASVFQALNRLEGVRGRMQLAARRANGGAAYVDYAHTPDALATAIDALRPHCQGRLVVVFGAGGDRDPGKRVLMGEAVAARADLAIVTDDNPRSEDPAAIRNSVIQGVPMAENIGDRAGAILAGVEALQGRGDCLLIAGKGHETGQEVGGHILPFDDVEQARAAVMALDRIEQPLGGAG